MKVCSKNITQVRSVALKVLHVQLLDLSQPSLLHLYGATQIHEAMVSMISLCDPGTNTFTIY